MKKTPPTYRMTAMISLISPLNIDSYLGFRHILSGWKRLKAQVFKCVINEYKRLVEDSNIKSQGVMKFDKVAPIGELRIYTCYAQCQETPYEH